MDTTFIKIFYVITHLVQISCRVVLLVLNGHVPVSLYYL